MQSFILSSPFLWASKPGEAIGTYWKTWREAELGGVCRARPAQLQRCWQQNCRWAAHGWCGDAEGKLPAISSSTPPHYWHYHRSQRFQQELESCFARDGPSASENIQLIADPVEILLMYLVNFLKLILLFPEKSVDRGVPQVGGNQKLSMLILLLLIQEHLAYFGASSIKRETLSTSLIGMKYRLHARYTACITWQKGSLCLVASEAKKRK